MGLQIGRDAFFDLLYQNFMLVRRLRNNRKTTYSDHWMHKYPNLIEGYTPDAPNRLWVSDITYVDLDGGSSYLSLITDAYSHTCACAKYKQDSRLEPWSNAPFERHFSRTENGIEELEG